VETRDRFRGALLGLAVGDAVGTTLEFKPPGTFAPIDDMRGGGPFDLPAGAWTDDTSMALCLAESLVEVGGFDPVDQLARYVRWYREGHMSSNGKCFDIGNATRQALHRFELEGEAFPGDADVNAAGNGVLMKLAPVPMAFLADPRKAVACAAASARTTHGAPAAADAARYFAGLLVGALNGASKDELLDGIYEPVEGLWADEPLHLAIAQVAAGSFRDREPPEIQGSGYVVKALEAALWVLSTTDDFNAGVLAAANLGDDADTTAAIYGQLAGALYGVDAIRPDWLDRLVMRERIVELADGLRVLSRSGPAIAPVARVAEKRSPAERPLPGDAYWVIPGKVLAGPYPGAPSKAEARRKLEGFVDAGVTCFLDLTEEGEGPGNGLTPYAELLRRIARERGTKVTHVRMPIRDVDIPSAWLMRAIQATLTEALAAGEVVYVHCWGGVGRTGTVVGCLLLGHGSDATGVLDRIADLRRDTLRAHRASPETGAQIDFVRAWEGVRP
jgi:ADP-ribosyl-[dinitrogen reductase] hydrolase